jgi:hypothetical protein
LRGESSDEPTTWVLSEEITGVYHYHSHVSGWKSGVGQR